MLQHMEEVNRQLEVLVASWSSENLPQFSDLNIEFHLIVLEASGSRLLKSILTPMIDMPLTSFSRRSPDRGGVGLYEQAVRHHRELIDALKSGHIRHAGLDVFNVEPLPADHPLTKLPNVTLSAHSAFRTPEASENLIHAAWEHCRRIVKG